MMLINGQQQPQSMASDRGFQYGDGLFETIEVIHGHLVFFEQHLHRLTLGCQRLLLPELDQNLITQEAQIVSQDCSHGILKIIITRGIGGRGYQQPQPVVSTRVLSLHPFPNYPDTFQQEGVQVRFCQQRLASNPTLAGIKHLNRLEQILARAEWDDTRFQEGLMFDYNGYVIEGTMSNIFLINAQQLYTPSLKKSGVVGIMRDFILRTAQQWGIKTQQGLFTQQDLLNADALFITNSVIGIWSIHTLDNQSIQQNFLTRKLQQHLTQHRLKFYENLS